MRLYWICTLFISFSFTHCNISPNETELVKAKVIGRWTVNNALRNNRNTQTLNGAVMDISETQLIHNFYGIDSTYTISWKGQKIVANHDTFTIDVVQDSVMVVRVRLSNYNFKLSMIHSTPDSLVESVIQ